MQNIIDIRKAAESFLGESVEKEEKGTGDRALGKQIYTGGSSRKRIKQNQGREYIKSRENSSRAALPGLDLDF